MQFYNKKKEMRYMRMEQANYIKAIFTAIFAFLSALLGVLAVPVILLVACNLIDYMTGLIASKYRAEDINSYKSIRGIFKKVSMWLLVVVGAIIDEMLLFLNHLTIIHIIPYENQTDESTIASYFLDT